MMQSSQKALAVVPIANRFGSFSYWFDEIHPLLCRGRNELHILPQKSQVVELWLQEVFDIVEFVSGPFHLLHLVDQDNQVFDTLSFAYFKLFKDLRLMLAHARFHLALLGRDDQNR